MKVYVVIHCFTTVEEYHEELVRVYATQELALEFINKRPYHDDDHYTWGGIEVLTEVEP